MKHDGNLSHWWHRQELDDKINPPFDRYLLGYKAVAADAANHGIQIYNVNIPELTAIEEFPIIDFEKARQLYRGE